jgi:hypothetical protein
MKLYIFTFDNGQLMLVNLEDGEAALATTLITDKITLAHEWAEKRFDDPGSSPIDKAAILHETRSGAVIDCSRLMAFGPYIELPKEA